MFKDDLLALFKNIFDHAELDQRLLAYLVSFIPKVACPINVNDFQPISLLRWVYKLIAKVLAARLRKVLGLLVQYT